MTDFTINSTVWLNHRPYNPGQEDRLEADGYTDDEMREQVRRGDITLNKAEVRRYGASFGAEAVEEADDLEGNTVAELRLIAEGEAISVPSSARKADIIEAIETERAARAATSENAARESADEDAG
jgi:hypothetical protein